VDVTKITTEDAIHNKNREEITIVKDST